MLLQDSRNKRKRKPFRHYLNFSVSSLAALMGFVLSPRGRSGSCESWIWEQMRMCVEDPVSETQEQPEGYVCVYTYVHVEVLWGSGLQSCGAGGGRGEIVSRLAPRHSWSWCPQAGAQECPKGAEELQIQLLFAVWELRQGQALFERASCWLRRQPRTISLFINLMSTD